MKLETVKDPTKVKLKGVELDWVIEDGQPTRVTITDKKGNALTLNRLDSYSRSLQVLAPVKPIMVERFVLQGSVSGVQLRPAYFETHDKAAAALDVLVANNLNHALEIERVELPEDEVPAAPEPDIPF